MHLDVFGQRVDLVHQLPGKQQRQCVQHAGGDAGGGRPERARITSRQYDESATQRWRTLPLPGVWQHPPYFHDGSAATLADVASRYNTKLDLGLTPTQQSDLVAYLESL